MIPYDLDPSLHSGEPEPVALGDGFSPSRVPPLPPSGPDAAANPESETAAVPTQAA